jgi:hypothetical protein
MAKFNGRTCIVFARYLTGGGEGLEVSTVERDKIIQKDSDRVFTTQKIGTRKEISEIDEKEVVVKSIESKMIVGDGLFKKEDITEALFDLYIDIITTSGTSPNINVSQQIATTISISEIKALESAWSDGTDTSFYDVCKTAIGSDKKTTEIARVDLYRFVEAAQKSDAIINSNMFGNLDSGSGSDTCSSQKEEAELFVEEFLLAEEGSGVYPNKVPGMTDLEWKDLIDNNFSVVSCE